MGHGVTAGIADAITWLSPHPVWHTGAIAVLYAH